MSKNGELVRKEIERGNYPKKIYKYYPLNEKLLSTIRNKYLWFDSFKNYNDPYEGKCNVREDYTEAEIRQRLLQFGKVPAVPKEQIIPECNRAIKEALIQNEIQSRCCCLSAKNNDLLMWAHYADSYRGVCLEFDTAKLADSIDVALVPVRYEERYPQVDFLFNMDELTIQQVLTKAKVWDYEEEYRFISPFQIPNQQPFDISALKAIILGCKCDKSSGIYQKLLNVLPPHVKIKECIMDSSAYRLIIK